MTREEAIIRFERQLKAAQVVLDSGFGSNPGENDRLYRERKEMAEIALAALRGPTREQVVLCKDCRYWQGNNVDYQHPECRWKHDETPNKDDYCSFAERLEMSEDD